MHVEELGSSSLCSYSRTISEAGGRGGMGRMTQVEKLKLDTRIADHLVEMSSVLHF